METETASHILCECEALDELKFCHLCKYFMESRDYDEIPLRKVQYFTENTGLLAE
jgi:hypothetical protein